MTGSQRTWGSAFLITAFGVALVVGMGCRKSVETRAENLGKEAGEKLKYIDELAQFDSTQMRLGELAAAKSTDPAVQQLGERLEEDHRAHLETLSAFARGRLAEAKKLKAASSEEGVGGSGMEGTDEAYTAILEKLKSYSNESARTGAKDEKTVQELGARTGSDFDREFVKHARESQEEGKRFVEQGVERFNSDPIFAGLLAKTTPILDEHIAMASAVRK
jgi:predicted outer membrane protein